jgi:hypothetical protein
MWVQRASIVGLCMVQMKPRNWRATLTDQNDMIYHKAGRAKGQKKMLARWCSTTGA